MAVSPAMATHPVNEDKHGNPVGTDTAVAMLELREHRDADVVLCDYHSTGRIQFFSRTADVDGAVIRLARECGYELHFATTRSHNGTQHGYAEFLPGEAE
jgi:hypothetical protein